MSAFGGKADIAKLGVMSAFDPKWTSPILRTLAKIAGPLLVIVGAQTLLAVIYTLLVVFPALGKDYQAAVLSAGFTGISLGSTPTAIAAMTAVTKRYGPSPNAFVILPLASALFVSLVNVAAITLFLSL